MERFNHRKSQRPHDDGRILSTFRLHNSQTSNSTNITISTLGIILRGIIHQQFYNYNCERLLSLSYEIKNFRAEMSREIEKSRNTCLCIEKCRLRLSRLEFIAPPRNAREALFQSFRYYKLQTLTWFASLRYKWPVYVYRGWDVVLRLMQLTFYAYVKFNFTNT